jgi:hypothetical protein
MTSGQDANREFSDAEPPDIDPDIDTESLQRSRDAIDEGREAAREALKDEGGWTSAAPEEPGPDETAGSQVTEQSER